MVVRELLKTVLPLCKSGNQRPCISLADGSLGMGEVVSSILTWGTKQFVTQSVFDSSEPVV